MSGRPARILIVDDHPLLREGLRMRLAAQADLEVCGEAESEDEGFQQVKELEPDLVIVDIALKNGHGLELIKQLKAVRPKLKMLVLSSYDESLYAERCLRAGAKGYLNKQETNEQVVTAVRTVLSGDVYLSPKMAQQFFGKMVRGNDPTQGDAVESLSDREFEVFQLIGRGKSTSLIAQDLQLSVHTIETYREKIRHKLGVQNSAELMQRAVQWVLEHN